MTVSTWPLSCHSGINVSCLQYSCQPPKSLSGRLQPLTEKSLCSSQQNTHSQPQTSAWTMCSEAAEEKRTQWKAESAFGLCYSRAGGKRRVFGAATDPEQPCVCQSYFMSTVMRHAGSVGAFSLTLFTTVCPPSSELFKETNYKWVQQVWPIFLPSQTGCGQGSACRGVKSIMNSVVLSGGCQCQGKDNHPFPGAPESAAAALFKWHEGRSLLWIWRMEGRCHVMNPMACFVQHSQSQNRCPDNNSSNNETNVSTYHVLSHLNPTTTLLNICFTFQTGVALGVHSLLLGWFISHQKYYNARFIL